VGERWGCLTQDRTSRFVIAWSAASTEEEAAPGVIQATRQRTKGQVGSAFVSDGNPIYAEQIRKVYRDPQRTGKPGRPPLLLRDDVRLTQNVKQREGGRVVGITVRAVLGEAASCAVCVCEERLNGVLRDRLNCLTRKTHGFAKRSRTWDAALGLCLLEHNWLRPHKALRRKQAGLPHGRKYVQRTPAMAVGLTDHVWTWKEFLSLQCHQYKKE
jgi:hypothetical protein